MINFIIGAIKVIILLGFLVLIHEAGHFLVAKKCKVKVLEFSIGFGKEIKSKNGEETKYTLRMIPLGGYVRMLGEEEQSEEEGAFNKAPIWKRILIVVAGAFVNLVFGFTVFFILASIYNKSAYSGLLVTKNYAVSLIQSLGMLVTGNMETTSLVGPVGISEMVVKTSSFFDFFYLLSVISVSLGITNLLPIPSLDGGKLLILIIELIRRKPMKENTELTITALGLIFLLSIATLVTIKDVGRII